MRRHVSNLRWLGAAFLAVVPAYIACGSDNSNSGPSAGDSGSPQKDGGSSTLVDGATNPPIDGSWQPPVDAAGLPPIPTRCNGSVASTPNPVTGLPAAPALTVPAGFTLEVIASVFAARELVALPNGDLLVATDDAQVYIVPNADSPTPSASSQFVLINDTPTQGITYVPYTCTLYVATEHGVYSFDYMDGQQSATASTPIALVRQGTVTPNSDGDVHNTTSLAYANGALYASVGSGCNACTEVDPTRATIQQMNPDGTNMATYSTRMRNAIALAVNPATGVLWAGGAGQDNLPLGHPYEYFDAVTSHASVADYGWPDCEENHVAYVDGSDCSAIEVPRIELPAYSTIIGGAFYPAQQTGAHAFGAPYQGGLFLTSHGSWHTTPNTNTFYTPPRIAFAPMNGDQPVTPVDWNDPSKQWSEFIGGFQTADGTGRIARPTGIAIGRDGTLFFSDDQNSLVYRVRPQ